MTRGYLCYSECLKFGDISVFTQQFFKFLVDFDSHLNNTVSSIHLHMSTKKGACLEALTKCIRTVSISMQI